MRIVNALIIGVLFAILPFPILLQAEAAECGRRPQYSDCYDVCPGGWEDCMGPCNARVTAAEEQWIQCIQQGPSEAKSPSSPPPPPHTSSSSSSSLKPKQVPTPKTKIYQFGDLKEGGKVSTGKGERAIIFVDSRGSRVSLEPNSTVLFVKPDEYQTLKGKCTFFFKKLLQGVNTPYRVRTPTAIAGVRGTEFVTSVTKTKTVVQVLDGLVRVSNLQGTKSVDVPAGYQTTATKTKLQTPKPFTEKQRIIKQ